MAPTLVQHVVADAGAFLKKAALQDIGRKIYTLREVVDEIRDRPTRRSLAFLPYQLHFKEPHPEHIRLVTEFSKKTGDYPSLSATDIKVLALTYQLELENVGATHLRAEPQVKVNVVSTQRHPETPVNIAGFHFPSKKAAGASNVSQVPAQETEEASPPSDSDDFSSFLFWRTPPPSLSADLLRLLDPVEDLDFTTTNNNNKNNNNNQSQSPSSSDSDQFNSFTFWRTPPPALDEELLGLLAGESLQTDRSGDQSDDNKENEPDEDDEDEDDDDDDDGGGWITPSNIRDVKMESSDWTAPADVTVGCLTTDFAMQNVLIQIGLHVLSVDGMLIKQARNYILRCHACFRTTSIMDKVFCPHCGNKTLKKVAVTVGEDGTKQMHFSKNPKVLNTRGLRHSLPQPQGGKHGSNPVLVEDQRLPQQRLSRKARQKTNVFDPDYVAGASPFSLNDVYSRAANLHLRDAGSGGGRRRANPNANDRKFTRRK